MTFLLDQRGAWTIASQYSGQVCGQIIISSTNISCPIPRIITILITLTHNFPEMAEIKIPKVRKSEKTEIYYCVVSWLHQKASEMKLFSSIWHSDICLSRFITGSQISTWHPKYSTHLHEFSILFHPYRDQFIIPLRTISKQTKHIL